jgi:hypothetical protein
MHNSKVVNRGEQCCSAHFFFIFPSCSFSLLQNTPLMHNSKVVNRGELQVRSSVQRYATSFRVAPGVLCNAMQRHFVLHLSAYTNITFDDHAMQCHTLQCINFIEQLPSVTQLMPGDGQFQPTQQMHSYTNLTFDYYIMHFNTAVHQLHRAIAVCDAINAWRRSVQPEQQYALEAPQR